MTASLSSRGGKAFRQPASSFAYSKPISRSSANQSTSNYAMKILLDARESAELLGMSLRKFRDDCKLPDFPHARSLGPRSTRWVRTELEAYAAALPAVRVDEPPQLAAARAARAAGQPTAHAPFPAAT
jgi:predicted DNA-binding transcriptional regulator AlpA